ncbi:MAG: DUF4139 domain-containing protein [Desulfovibrio sp.]
MQIVKPLLFWFLWSVLLPVPLALASGPDKGATSTAITVYPAGKALITEVREMNLPAAGEVAYPGAPSTLDPTSVGLRSLDAPDQVRVRSLRVLPSAADARQVLQQYVGRRVLAVLPDESRADRREKTEAVLLSVGSQVVLDLGDELYVGPLDAVLLPRDEQRPRSEAALLLDVVNQGDSSQRVEVSYLAGGLDWSGDCALSLDSAGERGALSCWATLRNDTGRAFENAQLRLVAGEVRREQPPMLMRAMKADASMVMEESMAGNGATMRQAGEYHVFDVPFAANLADGQTTRLALASADGVQVERELLVRGNARHRQSGAQPEARPVENVLLLRNVAENGLGRALPASLVRVYRDVSGGGRILEGEARMADLPVGEVARLPLGSAFDLSAERTMLDYERTGKHSIRVEWQVELRNAGEKSRNIMVAEEFSDDWKITDSNHKYAKESATTATWNVAVPAGGEPVQVRYTAEISWAS